MFPHFEKFPYLVKQNKRNGKYIFGQDRVPSSSFPWLIYKGITLPSWYFSHCMDRLSVVVGGWWGGPRPQLEGLSLEGPLFLWQPCWDASDGAANQPPSEWRTVAPGFPSPQPTNQKAGGRNQALQCHKTPTTRRAERTLYINNKFISY